MRIFHTSLILLLCLLQAGCGFQLRGDYGFKVSRVFVLSINAARITAEVSRQLQEEGLQLVTAPKEAQVVIRLENEIIDRRVLSVSALTGKLEEVELNYRVDLKIESADEKPLMSQQTISLLREYSFEETAVLAKTAEEQVLREDMFKEAVAQVIRRVALVNPEA